MSDDEEVLFESVGTTHSSKVGLINKKVKNVSDVLEGTGEDRRLKKTFCLCGAFLSVGFCIAVLGPSLPFLQEQTGSAPNQLGYIFLGRGFGYFLGSMLAGCLFEVLNPLMILGVSLAACTVSMGLIPSVLDVSMLMFLFVFVGMAMGTLDTGANVVCLQLWGKRSPPFMQGLHFSFAVGALLAPLLVKPFLSTALVSCNLNGVVTATSLTTIKIPGSLNVTDDNESGNGSLVEVLDEFNFSAIYNRSRLPTTKLFNIETTAEEFMGSEDGSLDTDATDESGSPSENGEIIIGRSKDNSSDNKPSLTTALSATILNTDWTDESGSGSGNGEIRRRRSKDNSSDNNTLLTTPLSATIRDQTTGATSLSELDDIVTPRCQRGSDFKVAYTYYIIAGFVAFNSLAFFYFFLTSSKKKAHSTTQKSSSGHVFGSHFNQQMLSIMFVFYFLYVGAEMAYGSFIFSYAIESAVQMSEEEASVLNSAFWISFATSRGLAIFFAEYIPPYYLLVMDMIGCLLSSVALLFFGATNESVLWFGTISLGASMASLFPTGLSWLQQYLKVTGKAAAVLVIGAASGEMVIPFLVGQYFPEDSDKANVNVLMYMILAISLALPLLFYVANSITENINVNHYNKPTKEAFVTKEILQEFTTEENRQSHTTKKNAKKIFSSKKHKE